MKYINVTPGSIPGVEIHDGVAFCKVAGKEYPVIAVIADEKLGYCTQSSCYGWRKA